MKIYATHTMLAPITNRSPMMEAWPSLLPEKRIMPTPTMEITAPATCAGRRRVRYTTASASMVRIGMAARISEAFTVEVR